MNKQQLAAKLWESANNLRGKIEANEYKDYILGFMFYKFLSDKEENFLFKRDWTQVDLKTLNESDSATVENCQDNIGYFISYENLFSTWIDPDNTSFTVSTVRDALSAFNRLIGKDHKKVFEKIFETLQTGLSKLGDTDASRTKAIRDLLNIIKDIPMEETQDYDVLGYIYEYLIGNFAANAGKKAGEFYTPHEVALLMAEIVAYHLRDKEKIEIYDPCSGSASLLLNIGKAVSKQSGEKDNIKYFAQEYIPTTYNLTRMNLVMRGILPSNIVTRNGDTLAQDWPFFDENHSYQPLFVDAVVANPPYSQKWHPEDRPNDPRFDEYGYAPKGKADYAFLLHNLYHTNDNGIMTIVLPHGVLFRGGEEGEIRKNLIERNKIDAIIGLPPNIFFGTGIPTIVMVLKKNRENTDILFIDASKGFVKEGKNNKLRARDIKKIADTYIGRFDIPKFSRKVSRDEIRVNDYNLNIPRYVDSSEKAESWDIYATMFGGIPENEIEELAEYWKSFPTLKNQIFRKQADKPFYSLACEDIKNTIETNPDVKAYKSKVNCAFSDYDKYLKKEWIENARSVVIPKEEKIVGDEIFRRLEGIPLIDKYAAYEILDNKWKEVSTDLEIIQSEGMGSIKVVDPNMVTQKKDGKTIEKQDGYKGRILPFELVQTLKMTDEFKALGNKESESAEQQAIVADILSNLSEEEKEDNKDYLNEDGDAFNNKSLAAYVKILLKDKQKYEPDSIEQRLINAEEAIKKDKAINKEIKVLTDVLEDKTKEYIENLSDAEALELLEAKWIPSHVYEITGESNIVIKEFEDKVEKLAGKYAETYHDVSRQINDIENSLSSLIDELMGNEIDLVGLKEFQNSLGK